MMLEFDRTPYRDKLNGGFGCVLCKDTGWHEITGTLQWCTCDAAFERMEMEPHLLQDIRTERARLATALGKAK